VTVRVRSNRVVSGTDVGCLSAGDEIARKSPQ